MYTYYPKMCEMETQELRLLLIICIIWEMVSWAKQGKKTENKRGHKMLNFGASQPGVGCPGPRDPGVPLDLLLLAGADFRSFSLNSMDVLWSSKSQTCKQCLINSIERELGS